MLTLTFAEHYQRWYLFIRVESQIGNECSRNNCKAQSEPRATAARPAVAASGCVWPLNIGQRTTKRPRRPAEQDLDVKSIGPLSPCGTCV